MNEFMYRFIQSVSVCILKHTFEYGYVCMYTFLCLYLHKVYIYLNTQHNMDTYIHTFGY
jgi:hypothetical protein